MKVKGRARKGALRRASKGRLGSGEMTGSSTLGPRVQARARVTSPLRTFSGESTCVVLRGLLGR